MREKHKDKIKKLLELSLSDNENEAGIALKQAMALMNKHNISEEEVHGQSIVNEKRQTSYFRIPDWYRQLYYFMSKLSGCFCVYRQGDSSSNRKGEFQLVGRERDVENAEYLIAFLSREIENHVKVYKQKLTREMFVYNVAHQVKSYRMGFIKKIYHKMQVCQQQFFAQESKTSRNANNGNGTDLVCIDNEQRYSEAENYYLNDLGQRYKKAKRQSRYYDEDMSAGYHDADGLEIRNAVRGQSTIHRLTKC